MKLLYRVCVTESRRRVVEVEIELGPDELPVDDAVKARARQAALPLGVDGAEPRLRAETMSWRRWRPEEVED